jgi:hypothetical protein
MPAIPSLSVLLLGVILAKKKWPNEEIELYALGYGGSVSRRARFGGNKSKVFSLEVLRRKGEGPAYANDTSQQNFASMYQDAQEFISGEYFKSIINQLNNVSKIEIKQSQNECPQS